MLSGCGTALVTPFRDGAVDYEAYAALVDRQVAAGVDFLVPLATTGETPTLSAEEKLRLLDITREHACGKPLLVGCGSNSIPGTLANIELLKGHGADAWLVVVPFYNKPTQEGMYLYYKELSRLIAADGVPVVIYNVPGRTGANMTAQTCLRIAREVPGIAGIKEASGKFDQVCEILEGAPDGFSVLSGDDDMTFSMMEKGAHGVISVASNVAPAVVSEMTHLMLQARAMKADPEHCSFDAEEMVREAAVLDASLQPLFKGCFVESNPIPAKAALSLMGLCTKEMRLPLTEASDSTVELMKELIQAF